MAAKSPPKTSGAIFGASERSSSSGSMKSIRPILSMDLRLEDVRLGGGGFLSALSSDDIVIRLKSAELVEDILLPDTAATASAALKAGRPSATSTSYGTPSSNQHGGGVAKLTSRMEKLSTSDEIALLDEKFWISSGEWLPDNDVKPANSVDMHPSMFLDINSHLSSAASGNAAVSQHSKSPTPNPRDTLSGPPQNPPLALAPFKSPLECQAATTAMSQKTETCLGLMYSSSSRINLMRNSLAMYPPLKSNPNAKACEDSESTISSSPKPPPKNLMTMKQTAASTTGKKRTSTGKKKKKKKTRRPRELDMTLAVEVTDHDILFGRGGKINNHPGNQYFRDKALQFMPWYIQSSKEEKEKIADVLIESVENEGRRFLEKKDKLWYKVVRGQHIKAGATLRDLKDGTKKKKG